MNTFSRAHKYALEWARYFQDCSSAKLKGKHTPIVVSGPQRCGTTWFGQMIQVRGTSLYHEPFGKFNALWNFNLKETDSGIDELGLASKVKNIVERHEWETLNQRHWNPDFRRTSRFSPYRFFPTPASLAIIKDLTAVGILEELKQLFEFRTAILLRHPCGYVASLKKFNWDPTIRIEILKTHPVFSKKVMSCRDLKSAHEPKTLIEKLTVQYCLLCSIALNFHSRNPNSSFLWKYDALAGNPIEGFRDVFTKLELPHNSDVEQYHLEMTSPQKQSQKKLSRHAVKRSSREAANSWRHALSDLEIQSIKDIWMDFGLDFFNDPNSWV